MFYHDTNKSKQNIALISTVMENQSSFTKRQVEGATISIQLYKMIGRLSHSDFFSALQIFYIKNCPISADKANTNILICVPDIRALKGKTTRNNPAT